MPKRRPTIPIAHADDVPTTSYDWLMWTYGGYTTSTTSIIAQMMQRPGWCWLLAPFLWQAIEDAYRRPLNAEVRQQITTVTMQYLKDCGFERAAGPKAMAWERIERIRQAAGDLESVMLNREAFSASSDELSGQRQTAHFYADHLIRRHLTGPAFSDEAEMPFSAEERAYFDSRGEKDIPAPKEEASAETPEEQDESQDWDWWQYYLNSMTFAEMAAAEIIVPNGEMRKNRHGKFEPAYIPNPALSEDERRRRMEESGAIEAVEAPKAAEAEAAKVDELPKQQSDVHSYADGPIRRHLDKQSLAQHKLHHFRDVLKSLIVACDCALGDLSATENCDDEPWNWWIQGLTRIAREHGLPAGTRIVEISGEPSPFAALVRALQEHVPGRHTLSDEALAKAIQRAQSRARDK
jgi:hypothetical protein